MQHGVSFTSLATDAKERFHSLRDLLGIKAFGMNQIFLNPGARGRIHKHRLQEEVYLVLEGTLSLAIEEQERDLHVGELARVAPDVRRQLINRGPGRCVVLALGAAGEHVGRDGLAFPTWDELIGVPPQDVPLPADLPPDQRRGE
jgi:uncharacterized cupin superfamily protein